MHAMMLGITHQSYSPVPVRFGKTVTSREQGLVRALGSSSIDEVRTTLLEFSQLTYSEHITLGDEAFTFHTVNALAEHYLRLTEQANTGESVYTSPVPAITRENVYNSTLTLLNTLLIVSENMKDKTSWCLLEPRNLRDYEAPENTTDRTLKLLRCIMEMDHPASTEDFSLPYRALHHMNALRNYLSPEFQRALTFSSLHPYIQKMVQQEIAKHSTRLELILTEHASNSILDTTQETKIKVLLEKVNK
jgi:hypothetical protein